MFPIIIPLAQFNLEFFFCFDKFSSLFLHQILCFRNKKSPCSILHLEVEILKIG